MCSELRTTKQQMRDFVQGIPIPVDNGLSQEEGSPTKVAAAAPRKQTTMPSPSIARLALGISTTTVDTTASATHAAAAAAPSVPPAPATLKRALTNPYQKSRQRPSPSVAARPNPSTQQQQQPSYPLHQNPNVASARNNATTESATTTAATAHRPQKRPRAPPQTRKEPPAQKKPANPFDAAKQQQQRPNHTSCLPVYKPGPVSHNAATAATWIYPVTEKYPARQYQVEISETAVQHNTLVSLPTGLGKTLIAAVVLYNYYRWFPTGKVLFLAPTLPLVNQQVKACYDIMGVPAADTAVLTGKISAAKRYQIWRDKRVFFCTPQTVQKDLETTKCPARGVVCVVLDEAHKTTGEYAYVKVIELLQAAGAKFRILGLSATPGTNIQAIQSVVDALHINKIEARRETDPNVAKYIHERQHEIVVVPQTSASKTIERALNNVVGPLLDRLRKANALPQRLTGNATITAYNLIQAKDSFQANRPGEGGMLGFFLAAQTFVQIRSDLHKHGVGIVRNKLLRLRNQPQRGLMSSIVKGDDFGKLWEEVAKSTWDPDSSQADIQDKLMNNPKLTKLREILIEHFERARACSKSSRAIVFSQFRDSVSEIVSILSASEPLIRPRHFVGQGKGGKSDGKGVANVKGMKQAEQHQVIKEFREDVHNVLVCTCIGEEGLDIGEVDLIVNFDTLRSPIRMIQRVGRTGRKRDGRVVCLVAEGPEEKTLVASKQSERTLAHALKNPKSFKVTPTEPMFLTKPTMARQTMQVSQNFHMSQVEGHDGAKKSVRAPIDPSIKALSKERLRWRLTEDEERRRAAVLGATGCIPHFDSSEFPVSLTRRLFAARQSHLNPAPKNKSKKAKQITVGRSARLLQCFESTHAEAGIGRVAAVALRSRSSRGEASALEVLFPIVGDTEAEKAFAEKLARSSRPTKLATSSVARPLPTTTSSAVAPKVASIVAAPLQRQPETAVVNPVNQNAATLIQSRDPQNPYSRPALATQSSQVAQTRLDKGEPFSAKTTIEKNQVAKSMQPAQVERTQQFNSYPPASSAATESLQTAKGVASSQVSKLRYPTLDDSSGASPCVLKVQSAVNDRPFIAEPPVTDDVLLPSQEAAEAEDFRLPTQDDSSSSEDEDDNESTTDVERPQQPVGVPVDETKWAPSEDPVLDEDSFRLPTQDSASSDDEQLQQPVAAPFHARVESCLVETTGGPTEAPVLEEDSFRLPTQDSSSSEDDSDGDMPLIALKKSKDEPLADDDYEQDVPLISLKKNRRRKSNDLDDVPLISLKRKKPSPAREHVASGQPLPPLPPAGGGAQKCTRNPGVPPTEVVVLDDSPAHSTLTTRTSIGLASELMLDQSDTPFKPLQHKRKVTRRTVLEDDDDDTPEKPAAEDDILVDTPVDVRRGDAPATEDSADLLTDTPQDDRQAGDADIGADDIVCAVCMSGESADDDPIILCDGYSANNPCDLAVHATCYSATVNLDTDEPWRCDPCEFRNTGGRGAIQCGVCSGEEAPLKKVSLTDWRHPGCRVSSEQGPGRRLRRLQQGKPKTVGLPKPSHSEDVSPEKKTRKLPRKRNKNGLRHCRFMDQEAGIDSGEEGDGDEEEADLVAIEEEEEFYNGFINDSSQLGYTQDALARVDPGVESQNHNDDTVHRTMDLERERMREFATPMLNRRTRDKTTWSATQSSGAGSEKGLGNMHFIRSVLEHHRHGGCADDIENVYNELEEEAGPVDEQALVPERPPPNRTVMRYESSDED